MSADVPPNEALPEYVRALLRPDAYPSPPPDVELRQTHISYVFLAGDVVYKTKKPVDFGFIDQVAPERREAFCHAEVRLNRRLAPDVYLGVGPIVRLPGGRIVVLPAGEDPPDSAEVVEWSVQMRRLPDDRTLRELLPAGAAPPRVAEQVVRRLIAFHERADVVANDPDFAGAAGEAAWWAREYGETEGYIGDTWTPRGRRGHARLRRGRARTRGGAVRRAPRRRAGDRGPRRPARRPRLRPRRRRR